MLNHCSCENNLFLVKPNCDEQFVDHWLLYFNIVLILSSVSFMWGGLYPVCDGVCILNVMGSVSCMWRGWYPVCEGVCILYVTGSVS